MSDNGTPQDVTYKQRRAIVALLATRTIEEAAQAARISRRTLQRWLQLPIFRAAVRKAQIDASQAILQATMTRLTQGQQLALDVLADVMERGKPNERRQAAVSWMSLYCDLKEVQDFETRLDDLERFIRP